MVGAEPVSGGCISDAHVLLTDRGVRYFLKTDRDAPPGFFAAEADGLRALAAVPGVRTPEVIGWSDQAGAAWLLLEHVAPGTPTPPFWTALGEMVAGLHGPEQAGPGYPADNYIGSLPQANRPCPSWGAFWRERRIAPQLERAFAERRLDREDDVWPRLMEQLPALLEDAPARGAASLLHGDLWSGNVYADAAGRPVLIDPAVYRGDGEVDLAMSELFGGFGAGFYHTYQAVGGALDPGYARVRRAVYQLYPLLVHVNLFGGGYAASARGTAASILRSAGRR